MARKRVVEHKNPLLQELSQIYFPPICTFWRPNVIVLSSVFCLFLDTNFLAAKIVVWNIKTHILQEANGFLSVFCVLDSKLPFWRAKKPLKMKPAFNKNWAKVLFSVGHTLFFCIYLSIQHFWRPKKSLKMKPAFYMNWAKCHFRPIFSFCLPIKQFWRPKLTLQNFRRNFISITKPKICIHPKKYLIEWLIYYILEKVAYL